MSTVDWPSEIGAHADTAALEQELADQLDAEGSSLTNRNAYSSWWSWTRQVVVAPILALEGLLVAVVPQGFLRHSQGVWLNEKAKEFGATRKAAVKAQGTLTFSRTGTTGNVPIPAGTIVATPTLADGTVKRVLTLEADVLPDAATEVDVLCEAELAGAAYNLAAGAYTVLVTPISGIEAVTNAADWLTVAGVNAETDAALIARILAAQEPGGEGWIGGDQTYLAIARNFTGVVDAVVDGSEPRGRGTVDVIIVGGAGQPTQQLIDDLTAHLDEEGKPITDDVLVKGPADVTVNVDVDAVAYTDDPRTDPDIQSAVEAVLDGFFTFGVGEHYLRLAEDYVQARVAAEAIDQAGLKTLRFTTPAADVAVGIGELAVAGTRVVTVIREDA